MTEELADAKKILSRIGLSLTCGLIVTSLVQFIFVSAVMVLFPSLAQQNWISYAAIAIGNFLVMFPLFYFMTKNLPESEHKSFMPLSVPKFIMAVILSFAVMYLFNMLGIFVTQLLGTLIGRPVANPLDNLISTDSFFSPPSLITLTLVVGIGAPIAEEYIFRKIILNKLRVYGDKIAIGISALMFGLFHGNFSQFFYAWALGIIFAYVTVRTNSVRYSIALHMIVNLFGSVIIPSLTIGEQPLFIALVGIFVITIIIAGIVLFIINFKKFYFEEGTMLIEPENRFFTLHLNVGMIVFYVFCTFLFVVSIVL